MLCCIYCGKASKYTEPIYMYLHDRLVFAVKLQVVKVKC
ncbi:hypothetical protein NLO413_0554 [Candidatus Neoehrlichia lotoris str. RAC413]|uniref:Uncharacterized protein n=1 Tax=Candidatus Neoehrlichia procyonis str. RAC413 TaxID=1359163 RepID=A0A0F3NNB4_9RICK|nr:hypothetical protein NLO413_0554 [Candidatus Neoehrlichia lotoris str. RAC413]